MVSGIAESFSAEEVVGRQVCVLVNLAPREIKGILSNGMILMTEHIRSQQRTIQLSTLKKHILTNQITKPPANHRICLCDSLCFYI